MATITIVIIRNVACNLKLKPKYMPLIINFSQFSSRRARTMESLTSLYAEEDVVKNLEESARLQRAFANYFDLVVINESHEQTYREVMEAWMALQVMDQWVPSTWIYS